MRILLGWILPVNSDQKNDQFDQYKKQVGYSLFKNDNYEQNYIHPVGSIFAAIQKNRVS